MPRDHFGSDHEYLPRESLLTYEEIIEVVEALFPLGLRKVRLTGGEPMLRRDLPHLIEGIRAVSSELDIAMTTNGALLAQHAVKLAKAGLDRVTVSLDALDEAVFQSMADTDSFSPQGVLRGIKAAQEAGLGVKVNTVVKKHVNEQEIIPLTKFFKDANIPLRFIEFMDVGNTNAWNIADVVSGKEIRALLQQHFGNLKQTPSSIKGEVAKRFMFDDGYEVGMIESVTAPFCGDCTRARLSAHGSIYTCLFTSKGHDIKSMLRMGATKEHIQTAIQSIWTQRNDQYSKDRSDQTLDLPKVEMSFIGG